MSDFSPADELRNAFAQYCSSQFGIDCDADMAMVGTPHADVVLRIAFCYNLDAEKCAENLLHSDIRIYREIVIADVCCVQKYINITLSDEYLERVADIIITKYPVTGELLTYAQQRAYMLSRQADDFRRVIKHDKVRRAFLELMKAEKGNAAEVFLAAQDKMSCYDGMGKLAECALRILCRN